MFFSYEKLFPPIHNLVGEKKKKIFRNKVFGCSTFSLLNLNQISTIRQFNFSRLQVLLPEVEFSRTSLASRTSSKTHFEVLGFGLESQVLGHDLEHSCPWPRDSLSSEGLSLASDFFCVLGLEPCVLDSTSDCYCFDICFSLRITENLRPFFVRFFFFMKK